MKPMKPVKAWAYRDALGIPRYTHTPITTEGEAIPVTITDARWMTRAEFEAIELEPSWGVWVWYLVDGVGELRHALYCQEDREYIWSEDYLDKDRIAYLQPIHAPSAPSEDE